MSPTPVEPGSSPAAMPEAGTRWRLGLGLALTILMLVAVLLASLVVHVSWSWTASRNIESVVASLNAQTASVVRRELQAAFQGAEGGAETIRSILFQGAVKADDEVKREFVFLSVLRSLPAVSWIGFGFPDGRFFGSHVTDDGRFEMVEIGDPLASGQRYLRRDRYRPIPGDIFFEERSKGETSYVTLGTPWFRAAKSASGPVWSMVDLLPSGFEPAAVVSTKLEQYGKFRGVLMVSVNLGRLSQFLSELDAADKGVAAILGPNGSVVASSVTGKAGLGSGPLAAAIQQATGWTEGKSGIVETDGRGAVYVTATPLDFNGWRLFTAIPRSAFTAEIDRNNQRLLGFVAIMGILAAAVAAFFANRFFARPIQRNAAELRHVESFSLAEVKRIPTWLTELDNLSGALKRMAQSLSSFGLYIPTEIVRTLIEQGVEPKPGGESREITVFFADLPGFTQMTERCGGDLAPFLTRFLTLATDAVHKEGGTVDKFIGDCIMAFWNAPSPVPNHAQRACRAALTIRDAMRNVPRPDGRSDGPRIRIGINTGIAIVGHVGSAQRLSYTAIGDVVNVASRLEALAKEYEAEIIVSEAVRGQLAARFDLKPLGGSAIRGRAGEIEIYELLAETKSTQGEIDAAA